MELDGSLAVSGDSRWCYLLHIPYIRHVTEIIGNESVVPQPIYAIVYANLGLMGNFPFTDLTCFGDMFRLFITLPLLGLRV